MTGGSQQLRRFRIAMRDGATVEQAADLAGMSIGEARLHVADDARNPPGPECFELIQPSSPRASPTHEAQPQENTMARGRKARPVDDNGEVVGNMDFARAVRLFLNDIAPAAGKVGEHAQEMSTAYKEIKKHCGIQPQAARMAFRLADMEDAKRDDWLRSFFGLINELNIGISEDLVDKAEQRDAAPETDTIPRGPAPKQSNRKPKPLATLPLSDGTETDLADAAEPAHGSGVAAMAAMKSRTETASNVVGLNPAARESLLN